MEKHNVENKQGNNEGDKVRPPIVMTRLRLEGSYCLCTFKDLI